MAVPPEQMQQALQQQAQAIADMKEEVAREQVDPEQEAKTEAARAAEVANLAEVMKKEELDRIAVKLLDLIEADENSRIDWKARNQDYLKLATQVKEDKSFPWTNASNVKYPLLTTSVMQFQSRCYKALLNGSRPVRTRVIGSDRLGLKRERADRISEHMSYQLMEQIPNWEEHQDTLCLVVPICGNAFKKTFYDGAQIKSELVLPQDLIVNYYSPSIEEARRKTHVMPLTINDVITNVRSGYYKSIDFEHLIASKSEVAREDESAFQEGQGVLPPEDTTDKDNPFVAYECHCWWDFDEDDYEEPYIITILKDTREIVRITPRFNRTSVELNAQGEVVRITPNELFTNYRFVPDPSSGVYGLGFGHILGPINEATNTIINQLIDSGTLSNLPSGWVARGARMQTGVQPFKPGEWRVLNTMGDDLRKSVVPIPVKDPSPVLFQMLSLFVEAGNQLASVTDMMKGESPGQNQPFSTTSAVMEQGLAVYATIFKRMHRAFRRELAKIYRLNQLYLDPTVYFNIIDVETNSTVQKEVSRTDYEKDTTDVVPNSDPEQITNFQKLADAELLMNLMGTGVINPQEAVKRILDARGITEQQKLLQMPPPPPDVENLLKEKELAIREKEADSKAQIEAFKAQSQAMRDQAAAIEKMTQAKLAEMQLQIQIQEQKFNQLLEAEKLRVEEKKTEAEKLKAEKEERDKKTVKATDIEAKDKKNKEKKASK